MRPANRPETRLRGAAALAVWLLDKGPVGYFARVLEAQDVSRPVALPTVPGLIGRSRAIELLANAVLPCLAALGPEESARRAEAAYRRLPLPASYGGVRHLHEAVGGGGTAQTGKRKTKNDAPDFRVSNFDFPGRERAGGSVRVDFRRQQGMLYLLKQYCTQGGCGRCPLS
jgi:hypothetical protein